MKALKTLLLACTLFLAVGATAQEAVQQPFDLTFTEDTHDFGDIEKDKPVMHEFVFTNTSGKTVTINNVKPSCGCTVPSYPKTDLKPGEKAVITAKYDAKKTGSFSKTLTVTLTGSDQKKVLRIKGKVVAPAAN
jgi:YbbR domain-containing protein